MHQTIEYPMSEPFLYTVAENWGIGRTENWKSEARLSILMPILIWYRYRAYDSRWFDRDEIATQVLCCRV